LTKHVSLWIIEIDCDNSMPFTIKDVVRESGVNTTTVSGALNNVYGVNHETRKHAPEVATRLNYRPNQVARGLVTGRSQTIVLVVSDIRNPFFAKVTRGAEDAAHREGRDLVLCNSDLKAGKQMDYFDSLLAKRVDGIVMNSVAVLSRAQQDQLWAAGVLIVLLNRSSVHRPFSSVRPHYRTASTRQINRSREGIPQGLSRYGPPGTGCDLWETDSWCHSPASPETRTYD
jgi:LacI family transcriptional regulator